MSRPEDTQGVERLLGMTTYLSKFLVKLPELFEPLRHLCDKDRPFDWLPQHEAVFKKIKKAITDTPVLRYYVSKAVSVECDASSVRLGAILTQDDQPVCYASRALSKTEQNYCQLEKECLAICYALEKLTTMCWGRM